MIKSTELCAHCNEEFDYEANDKEALITCPHCGKITTQCNMCDRYKCEDCTLSKLADDVNDKIESLKKENKVEQKYFRGLLVPTEPKRDWTWMKTSGAYCPTCYEHCSEYTCNRCIYSLSNHKARSLFYDLTFGKTNQEPDFEIGDIVEYTVEYYTSVGIKKVTVTSPILAVKKEDNKSYLVYWYLSDRTKYLDLTQHNVKLIKKAK